MPHPARFASQRESFSLNKSDGSRSGQVSRRCYMPTAAVSAFAILAGPAFWALPSSSSAFVPAAGKRESGLQSSMMQPQPFCHGSVGQQGPSFLIIVVVLAEESDDPPGQRGGVKQRRLLGVDICEHKSPIGQNHALCISDLAP